MNNWVEQIKNGVKPSALLSAEIKTLGEDYNSNQLIHVFVNHVMDAVDVDALGINLLDISYPIWYWEKPDKRRLDGIPTARMDKWIIEIFENWGLVSSSDL